MIMTMSRENVLMDGIGESQVWLERGLGFKVQPGRGGESCHMRRLRFMIQGDDAHSKQHSSLPAGIVLAFCLVWVPGGEFSVAFWGVEDTSCPFFFVCFWLLFFFLFWGFLPPSLFFRRLRSMYKVPTEIHNNTRHS